jgi:hypothetical protein
MLIAMPTRGRASLWMRTVLLAALLFGGASGTVYAASPIAAGQITDLQGHAIADALIQAESWESKALGTGRSDALGKFKIVLSETPVDGLTLTLEHPGFQRWSLAGTTTGLDNYRIRLTRNIDNKYLTALVAQSEPARFRQFAMDLLAPSEGTITSSGLLPEPVLPFLRALRPGLRALFPAEPRQIAPASLKADQDRAALMLAALGDPQDDTLVDRWAAKKNFISRPPKPCRGPTPEAAARVWQRVHFNLEGATSPETIPFSTQQSQIAPSGDYGLVLHTVRYANWGYSQYLVLVRMSQVWEVRRVIDDKHWDRFGG